MGEAAPKFVPQEEPKDKPDAEVIELPLQKEKSTEQINREFLRNFEQDVALEDAKIWHNIHELAESIENLQNKLDSIRTNENTAEAMLGYDEMDEIRQKEYVDAIAEITKARQKLIGSVMGGSAEAQLDLWAGVAEEHVVEETQAALKRAADQWDRFVDNIGKIEEKWMTD
ncbi:MAG: hypothetical protein ABII02_00690 [Candidatus Magasanikbacteria bacterium]